MKSFLCILAVIAAPLALTAPLKIELCSEQEKVQYIEASLNSECKSALARLKMHVQPFPLPPFQPPDISTENLETVCQASCAGAYADFLKDDCKDHYTAKSVHAMCELSSGTLGSRCRYSFPDVMGPFNKSILRGCGFSIETCQNDRSVVCPFLQSMADTFDCCYNSLYNNTDFMHYLVGIEVLNNHIAERILEAGNSAIWTQCSVIIPPVCAEGIRPSHAKTVG